MARSARGDGFSVKPKNTNTLDLFDDLMAVEPIVTIEDNTSMPKEEPKDKPAKIEPQSEVIPEPKPAVESQDNNVPKEKEVEKNNIQKRQLKTEKISNVDSSYNQPRKSITISVLEDDDMFLRFYAARNGISRQELLENIFSNEIDAVNAGNIPSLAEIKPYMKQLKEPTRFTAMLPADLIDAIKKSASLTGLRPTSFMAYVIHKKYLSVN